MCDDHSLSSWGSGIRFDDPANVQDQDFELAVTFPSYHSDFRGSLRQDRQSLTPGSCFDLDNEGDGWNGQDSDHSYGLGQWPVFATGAPDQRASLSTSMSGSSEALPLQDYPAPIELYVDPRHIWAPEAISSSVTPLSYQDDLQVPQSAPTVNPLDLHPHSFFPPTTSSAFQPGDSIDLAASSSPPTSGFGSPRPSAGSAANTGASSFSLGDPSHLRSSSAKDIPIRVIGNGASQRGPSKYVIELYKDCTSGSQSYCLDPALGPHEIAQELAQLRRKYDSLSWDPLESACGPDALVHLTVLHAGIILAAEGAVGKDVRIEANRVKPSPLYLFKCGKTKGAGGCGRLMLRIRNYSSTKDGGMICPKCQGKLNNGVAREKREAARILRERNRGTKARQKPKSARRLHRRLPSI